MYYIINNFSKYNCTTMAIKELTIINKDISPIITKAQSLVIKDAGTMEQASDFRSKLKEEEKRLEKDRLSLTAPINESLKAIRAKYAPAEDIIEKALSFLDKSMSEYRMALVQKQREEEKKISDRIGEGKGKLKLETAVKKLEEMEVITSPTNTSFRTDYVLEIVNEKIIPREYLSINESYLLASLKKGAVVPGAKLKEVLIPVNKRSYDK